MYGLCHKYLNNYIFGYKSGTNEINHLLSRYNISLNTKTNKTFQCNILIRKKSKIQCFKIATSIYLEII